MKIHIGYPFIRKEGRLGRRDREERGRGSGEEGIWPSPEAAVQSAPSGTHMSDTPSAPRGPW